MYNLFDLGGKKRKTIPTNPLGLGVIIQFSSYPLVVMDRLDMPKDYIEKVGKSPHRKSILRLKAYLSYLYC